jgi:hypothetical protein
MKPEGIPTSAIPSSSDSYVFLTLLDSGPGPFENAFWLGGRYNLDLSSSSRSAKNAWLAKRIQRDYRLRTVGLTSVGKCVYGLYINLSTVYACH